MEHGLFAVDHQCVTGIRAALIAYNKVRLAREDVDHFAFAFITPLRSNNDYAWHIRSLFFNAFRAIEAQRNQTLKFSQTMALEEARCLKLEPLDLQYMRAPYR